MLSVFQISLLLFVDQAVVEVSTTCGRQNSHWYFQLANPTSI